ncbi:BCCT family transporter [Arsenicicoccus piscis]|uniref:Choline transporter n=1 Tax=Arsenicicoccus piscis TaxID=673954 RepID=A0ABQ6HKD4_9MICO|nr:choline transporter [Arsenicicoccus piscis]
MTAQSSSGATATDTLESRSPTDAATSPASSDETGATGEHHLLTGLTTPAPRSSAVKEGIDWVVFGVTALIAIAFVSWGFASPSSLSATSTTALNWVMTSTGWLFVLLATGFVFFVLWLAASRYGRIPLGNDREEPEYSTVSWVAMMFSAGMGIGLMFYGVAEPLFHYVSPPPGAGAQGQTPEALQVAMATTMFHWALHPWAIYAVVGVAIAYSTFRKGRPQLVSSVFTPLFGKHANGWGGKVIDGLAIFATLFGSAASLGLGALQIAAGMEFNGWVQSVSTGVLLMIIAVLTVAFILSATSGIARGIQLLANINMVLALALALFVFVVGPTLFILNLLPTTLGQYLAQLPGMASRSDASGLGPMHDWLSSWTVFYWAWWISWTPFVGMFIATISRGRTIRQFVSGVLIVPSLVSLVWFCIFGGGAIDAQRTFKDLAPIKDGVPTINSDAALFQLLAHYPIASITTVLVMVLVAIFFVSGADAASIVMGTLSEHGSIEPTRKTVIFWGAATGAVAAVMLLAGSAAGDTSEALNGLKNITIVSAMPFVIVMGLMCWALVKDVTTDPLVRRADLADRLLAEAVVTGLQEHGTEDIQLVVAGTGTDAPAQRRPRGLLSWLADRRRGARR